MLKFAYVPNKEKTYGAVIVGAGILGTTLAYWMSILYKGSDIAVLEKEKEAGLHASSRNTGVIHRPFYLNPQKKKIFAKSALLSYELWKTYAKLKKLPWEEVGTLEVSINQDQHQHLKDYLKWAIENGMEKQEVELLTQEEIKKIEPNVKCLGALLCKTDTAVDFGEFTKSLKKDAIKNGVKFFMGTEVKKIKNTKNILEIFCKNAVEIKTKYLINCAGGNSLKIANLLNLGKNFASINFRGEYWNVSKRHSALAMRNIYSVPHNTKFPFLDPHWIRRANGTIEIGPTAIPVFGAYTYKGFFESPKVFFESIFTRSFSKKLKLFTNSEFLSLARKEWASALSKKEVVNRIKKFIPKIKSSYLIRKGTAGVRTAIIDDDGYLISEALEISNPLSFHILNYNSPGATSAPAYSAHILKKIIDRGMLNHLALDRKKSFWDFNEVVNNFSIKNFDDWSKKPS